MGLLGSGVLAIWNGVAPGADAQFAAWHVREHIPERMAVPGFLRGRRYTAIEGSPKYFNFYETETSATLTSPAYLARLDDPSSWTRRVVAEFRDTSRTICDVALSLGQGEGGVIETIRLQSAAADHAEYRAAMEAEVMRALMETPGITGVHLLHGRPGDSMRRTAEKALRGASDEVADWILLVEALDAGTLRETREGAGADRALARAKNKDGWRRGTYALQFSLTGGSHP
ncbi:MAG: hypothetical protein KGK10_10155 [Rhodospirillales bacterium]|nr:hypothetical protein [Rhodospirillales bacterium]